AGQAYKTIDPSGKEDRTYFDDAARVTKTIENYTDGDPTSGSADEDRTVEFTYTADGQRATITAKQQNSSDDQTTTYVYGTTLDDSDIARSDLLRAEIYPDSDDTSNPLGNGTDGIYDRIEYTYNRQGERLSLKDQNGSIHEYDYDGLGRQTHDRITTLASGVNGAVRRLSKTYEIRGEGEKSTSYDSATVGSGNVVNEVVREYNDFGLLDREYQEHSGAKDGNTPYVGYNYDETAVNGELENGLRPTSLRYPNGRLVHYTYGSTDSAADVLNRLNAINDDNSGSPGDVLASYTYLGLGTVVIQDYEEPDVRLDLFGGTSGTYAGFDRFDRVDVDRFKYGYDRASNPIWKENVVAANNSKDFDEFYTYDGLHRLQNFDRGDLNAGKTAVTGTPANEEDWSLDPLGNWSNFVQKTSGTTDLNQSRAVNEVNEITDITETTGPSWITPAFDRNGNMTTVPKPADPTIAFTCTYDSWNRMVKVEEGMTTVGEYAYDSLKRRITKDVDSTVRHFLYSSQWQSLEERFDSSTDPERQHIWGLEYVDQLVLRDRDTTDPANGTLDERVYAHQDANWNVTALVDGSGDAVGRYLYEPYGDGLIMDGGFSAPASDWDMPYTFSARRLDNESGLYYYRNRYYNSQLGEFISRDPVGFTEDTNQYRYMQSVTEPYVYVRNKPINLNDPSGLKSTTPCWAVTVLAIKALSEHLAEVAPCGFGAWPTRSMPHAHCVWNCGMVILFNRDWAEKCSMIKEYSDLKICLFTQTISDECWDKLPDSIRHKLATTACSAFQPWDFKDNETGRQCGEAILEDRVWCRGKAGNCKDCCTRMGVGPDTKDGPGTGREFGPCCKGRLLTEATK
ncbi:MAG: hypothetical protein HYV60_22830, partial [Planctomycetia bacterium]|nr:hypothetical protein [Planctomycetia bacterium]